MSATQCLFNGTCIYFYIFVIVPISFFIGFSSIPVLGEVTKRCKKNRVGSSARVCYCVRRTKAKMLYIAAENSSTLDRVTEQMAFLQDDENVYIQKLRLQRKGSMPDFRRTDYILCCAEQTSGRGIILSSDDGPDQLGALTRHANIAKAKCAIMVLGTRDPPNGKLYDESQMDETTRRQPRLNEYKDTDRLFSFCSALNSDQEKAICAWLEITTKKVKENHMELGSVDNEQVSNQQEYIMMQALSPDKIQ